MPQNNKVPTLARGSKTKEHKSFAKKNAEIAQLVEHNLAKVGVASSSLVFRSSVKTAISCLFLFTIFEGKIKKVGVSHETPMVAGEGIEPPAFGL